MYFHPIVAVALFYSASIAVFVAVKVLLPVGFAPDQEEYWELTGVTGGVNIPTNLADLKLQVMFYLSFLPRMIFNERLFVEFINYMLFVTMSWRVSNLFRARIVALSFFLLCPFMLLHSTLFLREIYFYISLLLFVFFIKRKKFFMGFVAVLILLICRPEGFAVIFPLLFAFSAPALRYKNLYLVMYLLALASLVVFFESVFSGYRSLFGVSSSQSLMLDIKNFILPSVAGIAGVMILVELALLAYLVVRFVNSRYLRRRFFIPLIISVFCGALLIGGISDNAGFVGRIRSPFFLMLIVIVLAHGHFIPRKRVNKLPSGVS